MYLKTLFIKNFRSIKETTVQWHKGVNVLVGENNTGKTAILDALRICLSFGDAQRDIWIRREDYHVSSDGKIANTIELSLSWSELTNEEKGVYIDMLVFPETGEAELQMHVRFEYDFERDRTKRPNIWGGENEGQSISPEILVLIEHVHLGALRDATRDLAPRRGNQLSRLFLKLVSGEDEQANLAQEINDSIRSMPNWKSSLKLGKKSVNEHLSEVSFTNAQQEVDIDFVDSQFRQIVEGLRVRLPAPSKSARTPIFFNIWQNGLGYNNLIYMATVFGDLLKRRERFSYASLSLIIEEPEVHLHPQLQDVLFKYLGKMGKNGIQVFLSSHSPTITAKTNLDALIALHIDEENVTSTPVRKIDMGLKHKMFLQRFMDVTKCQLFFAKSVILVEGISEALLLPAFAKALGSEYDLDKYGVEVVNISGVAFEPFACLFNSNKQDKRLNIHCAIVTDDDRTDTLENGEGVPSGRAVKAQTLSGGLLKVVLAKHTFEYELFLANEKLVIATYQKIHSKTDLNFTGTTEQKAVQFKDKIKNNKDKAVFAQSLSAKLECDNTSSLVVPGYIKKAMSWVVKGEWIDENASGSH